MHEMYHTQAVVLSGTDIRDSDKLLTLLTEELGVVRAVAKGVRKETSKLRYMLTDLSAVHVSLVRGREMWRVTGAEAPHGYPSLHTVHMQVLARLSALVQRLVAGEEQNTMLYRVVIVCRETLARAPDQDTCACIEILGVARILHALGYMPDSATYRAVLRDVRIDDATLGIVAQHRALLLRDINTSIAESQL